MLEPDALDFGTVARHRVLEETVRVCGASVSALGRLTVESDCTCLSGQVLPGAVLGASHAGLRVRLETCDGLGETRRTLTLRTNDDPAEWVRLAVRYRVVADVYLEHELVALGVLDGLQAGELAAEIRVHTLRAEPTRLLSAWSDDSDLTLTVREPVVRADAPGTVRVHVPLPLPSSTYRPTVWIATDCAGSDTLRVGVWGESVPGVSSAVREVVLDDVPLGRGAQRDTILHHAPGIVLQRAASNCPALTVAITEPVPGGSRVRLRLAEEAPLGEFWGELWLEFGGDVQARTALRIRGRVTRPPADRDIPVVVPRPGRCTNAEPCRESE